MPPLPRALVALIALLAAACSRVDAGGERPDVVLVVADTLRADRLSCYGHPRPTSPVLDSLAAGGALFEDVTAQCPWTLPSMVSLFHGRYLTSYRDRLAPELPTIARSFREAGYRTVAVVANALVDEGQGFAEHFEHFDARLRLEPDGSVSRRRSRDIVELLTDLEAPLAQAAAPDERSERAPLFLYVHAFDPHSPYFAHEALEGELPQTDGVEVSPPDWWERELAARGPAPPEGRADWSLELDELRRQRARYDQEVRFLDQGLARLVELLARNGIGENAVFALVSDHGEGLWEHRPHRVDPKGGLAPATFFYRDHGGAGYQEQLATPMVLWGAGVPAGVRVPGGVENIDLFPTLLDLADLAPPPGLDGRSLVPLMRGEQERAREHVFNYGLHAVSVRELASGLKLIVPGEARADAAVELYHLPSDPHERADLAAERPEDVRRLTQVLGDWLARHPLAGSLGQGDAAARAELARKLRALGYTEAETGVPMGR